MVVPLQVLTLGTSSYSHICSQVDIYHTTDTLVYDSVLCELTYVCALASAHTTKFPLRPTQEIDPPKCEKSPLKPKEKHRI